MANYSFSDLLNRYGMKKSAFSRFLARHLEDINKDGSSHAVKTPSGWVFDDYAIVVLDRLRNFGDISFSAGDPEQVKELNEIISALQQKLIKVHEENGSLKDQLLAATRDQVDLTKKLAAASIQVLQLQTQGSESDDLKNENRLLQEQVSGLKSQVSTMETESKRIRSENDELHDKIREFNKVDKQVNTGIYRSWIRRGQGRKIKLVILRRRK